MFKKIRILILLVILLIVAVNAYDDKSHDWSKPLYVAVYPVNVSGSPAVSKYIQSLTNDDFKEIERYFAETGKPYGQTPYIYYRLGDEVKVLPPEVPRNGSMLDAILWSLKFRYYAYRHANDVDVPSNLRLFLNYYDPNTNRVLSHTSTALQNGRIGVVHLFADSARTQNNNVVVAHEMLHAFGATDKYDLATGQPLEPMGLGDPKQNPRYPQKTAELMAVHKAISLTTNKMARSLSETVIGEQTATEIGWKK